MAAPFLTRNLETDERVLAMGKRTTSSARETALFAKHGEAGTVPALRIKIPSCATLPDIATAGAWGGARNRASRTSDCLTARQVELLLEGAVFAWRIGLPLNRHLTVHWEQGGVPDCEGASATGAFLKSLGDSIRKAGGDFAAIWARENGDGKGSHSHILAHVPAGHLGMVKRLQRRWVSKATGQPYRARALRGRAIAGAREGVDRYHANLEVVVRYVLKGANVEAARCHMLTKLEPGGTVIGKRCGTTQNIGRKASAKVAKSRKVC